MVKQAMKTIILMLVTVVVGAGPSAARPASAGRRSGDSGPAVASRQVVSITSIKQLGELSTHLDPSVRTGVSNPPQFFINAETFVFYLGDQPSLGDDFSGPRQQPILVPLAQIIRIQNLWQFIEQKSPADLPFWKFYFDDAIVAVQKGLNVIASGEKTGEALYSQLVEYTGYISLVFEKGARAFAASRNLTYRRGQTRDYATHKVSVTIVKDPSAARVFVIPASLYTSDGAFDFAWRELLESKPNLGGRYYYKVEWPDGTLRSPTPFTIDKAGMVLTINK